MQVLKQPALGRRSRYYQSHMDMDLLVKGCNYAELPDSYVIFLCDFDPFGKGKYRYTFQVTCREEENVSLKDGRCIVFLNTHGKNVEDVPKELVSFLRFVHADLKESQNDFQDDYVRQVQKSVTHIRDSREMEERFMLLELLLEDERREGRKEGRKEGEEEGQLKMAKEMLEMTLSRLGQLPSSLLEVLHQQQDIEIIKEGRKEGEEEGQLKMAKEMLEMTLSRLGQLPSSLLEVLHQQQDIEIIKSWMQTALTVQSLDEFISRM